MALFDKKRDAFRLRREGKSITFIANVLGISKGTASLWCRDVPLTDAQKEQLRKNSIAGGHTGRMRGAEANRQKKIGAMVAARKIAERQTKRISHRDLTLIAAALYWAEGSKTDSRFTFVNSDPLMVEVMCAYLFNVAQITKDRICLTVQINNSHRHRIDEVTRYWAHRLNIPLKQFSKPNFIHSVSVKVYERPEEHFGTLRLRVLRSSGLQYQMLGYIGALGEKNMLV